jgi:hypothetical protein
MNIGDSEKNHLHSLGFRSTQNRQPQTQWGLQRYLYDKFLEEQNWMNKVLKDQMFSKLRAEVQQRKKARKQDSITDINANKTK